MAVVVVTVAARSSVRGRGGGDAVADRACAQAADDEPWLAVGPAPADQRGPTTTDAGGPAPTAAGRRPGDAVAEAAIEDVEAYWTETYPEVYGDDVRAAWPAASTPTGPTPSCRRCGEPPPAYARHRRQRLLLPRPTTSSPGTRSSLIPWLNEKFGAFTVGIVFAHEFGHAIQARAGARAAPIDLELQADCFAGAWTARRGRRRQRPFSVTDDGEPRLQRRRHDRHQRPCPAPTGDDPLAHGSGFDRIGAFQDGYENGAGTAPSLRRRAPDAATVEMPFTRRRAGQRAATCRSRTSSPTTGLLARARARPQRLLRRALRRAGPRLRAGRRPGAWSTRRATRSRCGGEHAAGRRAVGRRRLLRGRERRGRSTARPGRRRSTRSATSRWRPRSPGCGPMAAQAQLGRRRRGKEQSLQADCLTGVWASSTLPRRRRRHPTPRSDASRPATSTRASRAFLAYGDARRRQAGTVFERTDALRTGVRRGLDACEALRPARLSAASAARRAGPCGRHGRPGRRARPRRRRSRRTRPPGGHRRGRRRRRARAPELGWGMMSPPGSGASSVDESPSGSVAGSPMPRAARWSGPGRRRAPPRRRADGRAEQPTTRAAATARPRRGPGRRRRIAHGRARRIGRVKRDVRPARRGPDQRQTGGV